MALIQSAKILLIWHVNRRGLVSFRAQRAERTSKNIVEMVRTNPLPPRTANSG